MITANNIQNAYLTGTKVGEGSYGIAKLVTYHGHNYILKYFGKYYDLATQDYWKAQKEGKVTDNHLQQVWYFERHAANEKKSEEDIHEQVYNKVQQHSPGSDYICKPYKSNHPHITIQDAANQGKEKALPLDKFMSKIYQGNLSMKRSIAEAKRDGKIQQMNFSNVHKTVGSLMLDMNRALRRAGVLHGDLKEDNIMAVFEDDFNGVVKSLKLKVIDFGLTQVNNKKPLVTTNLETRKKMNYSHLKNLHSIVNKRFKNPHGIHSEKYWYLPQHNGGARPVYMLNIASKYSLGPALQQQLEQNAEASYSKIKRALKRWIIKKKNRLQYPSLSQNEIIASKLTRNKSNAASATSNSRSNSVLSRKRKRFSKGLSSESSSKSSSNSSSMSFSKSSSKSSSKKPVVTSRKLSKSVPRRKSNAEAASKITGLIRGKVNKLV